MAVDQKEAVQQAYPFIRRGDLEIKRAWAYLRALKRAGELPAYGSITIEQLFGEFTDFAYISETEAEGVEINEWWKNNSDVEGTGTILENVSALRALNSDAFSTNSIATVLGYWTRGDGGTGDYYLDLADVASPDDNWSVIVDASGNRWKAVFESHVIPVERTGFRGIGTTPDRDYLQAALDYADDGSTFSFGKTEYIVNGLLMARRNKISLDGNFCTIKSIAPTPGNALIGGGLLLVANAHDVTVVDFNLDANGQYKNCLDVIGNTDEFDTDIIVGMQYAERIFIDNIRCKNAKFQINTMQSWQMDRSTVGFLEGEDVRSFTNDGILVLATIEENDTATNILTVNYKMPLPSVGRVAVGLTSGTEALISALVDSPQVEPISGKVFSSNQGEFGGKGFAIQYGVRSCIATNIFTDGCDVGIAYQSKIADSGETTDCQIHNVYINDANRCPIWLNDSSTADAGFDIQCGQITNVEVVNWGSDYPYVGLVTSDRGSNVALKNIRGRIESGYSQPYGCWVWYGMSRNCTADITALVQNIDGIYSGFPHVIWGALPGLVDPVKNYLAFNVDILGTTQPTVVYTDSLQTNTVQKAMIDWRTSDALSQSLIDIKYTNWSTADFILKSNSLNRFSLFNKDTNNRVFGFMSGNPTFDGTYLEKFQPNGNSDTMLFGGNVGSLLKVLAGNNAVEIGLNSGAAPHIQGKTASLRLTSPNNTTIATVQNDGFRVSSSNFAIPFGLGSTRFWLASTFGSVLYAKSGSNPANETDGYQVSTRWGYATKSGSFTYTVGTQQPVQVISGQAGNGTITLSTTGAVAGDRAVFTRTDAPAFTLDVGGLITIPAGKSATVEIIYSGSAWILVGIYYRQNASQIISRGTATVLAASGTPDRVVVTEPLAIAGRRILATAATEDLSAGGVKCVLPLTPASGQFTIVLDAPATANTDVFWQVIN